MACMMRSQVPPLFFVNQNRGFCQFPALSLKDIQISGHQTKLSRFASEDIFSPKIFDTSIVK
jgi:hypothetical protein